MKNSTNSEGTIPSLSTPTLFAKKAFPAKSTTTTVTVALLRIHLRRENTLEALKRRKYSLS